MVTVAQFYNEIIDHYDISTQEKLGGGKLRQQPPHQGRARTPSTKNGELKN